ncbi:hypothetical protein HY412_00525 [Candidatus Kaiserbacteria bacterium]|nr:hypothetical protein [Candidatus Kaiserbacteria bacterium]
MKSNTMILIATTLIIAAAAYWYFFTKTDNQAPLSALTVENQSQTQFQKLVSELQPISFSTIIFSDPRFMALVDLATPIASETAGRIDPFAPVSSASVKNE